MRYLLTLSLLFFTCGLADADFLLNGSFEDVPNSNIGQGLMPSDWEAIQVTPDTYSNDGSYGLSPNAFNNFTGVTAQDGIRWLAGAHGPTNGIGIEAFGQNLVSTLIDGLDYEISGYIHHSTNPGHDTAGGFDIYLNSTDSLAGATLLGSFDPTTIEDWEFRSFQFTAPTGAIDLDWIIFAPYSTGSTSTYPGLDNVVLTYATGIPEPTMIPALGFAFGWIAFRRRRIR